MRLRDRERERKGALEEESRATVTEKTEIKQAQI